MQKTAEILGITVGYLIGENEDTILLKGSLMVQRFRDIIALKDKEREHVLFALDAMIRDVKLKELTAA